MNVAAIGEMPLALFLKYRSQMIGVDLFCGAGGMSLGAKMAGVNVAFAVEADVHACATYATNHPEVKLFNGDIRNLENIPISSRLEETILFGGPPCQGFSTSNQRTRNRANNGNWMFKEFVRLLKSWKPDWFVFENVKGITETEGALFLTMILQSFRNQSYLVSKAILNAVDFGIPQKRDRLFVVGCRPGKQFSMPTSARKPIVTVGEALADLPQLENGSRIEKLPYKGEARCEYVKRLRNGSPTVTGHLVTRNASFVTERYSYVPPGGNWENIPPSKMGNYRTNYECHTGIYHRLAPEKPSIVIGNYRKNMLIHPFENRGLSVREAARIQSFPDEYKFCGSIGFQQQQVGNAVPPLLAKAVFEQIILTGEKKGGKANKN